MSARIGSFIRHNVLGLVAIFIALSGTAYATHPDGANTISTGDIQDGQVQNADLGPNAVSTSKVFPNTLTSSDIAAGAVGSSEVANASLGTADFATSIPAARVARTSAQGITSGIPSKRLNFTSERYDTAGLHSTSNLSRLTAPVTGIYEVTAHVSWDINSSGSRHVGLHQNANTELAQEHLNANAADGLVDQNIATVARFTAGQFLEVFVVQDSGGTRSVTSEATMTWLAPGP
jgi:hypothetical protein